MSEIVLNYYPTNLERIVKLRKQVKVVKEECDKYPTFNSFPDSLKERANNIRRVTRIIQNNYNFLLKEIAEYGDDGPTNVLSRLVCTQKYLTNQVFIRLLASLSLTNRLEEACAKMEMSMFLADRLQECMAACIMETA